jgi:ATP-dependent DNA helicase RecQ
VEEAEGCRHAALVGHFGEEIAPCGDACDRCTGEALELGGRSGRGETKAKAKAKAAPRGRAHGARGYRKASR